MFISSQHGVLFDAKYNPTVDEDMRLMLVVGALQEIKKLKETPIEELLHDTFS